MLLRLWRRVWDPNSRPTAGRPPAFRPQLDALEDRFLPAPVVGPVALGAGQVTANGSSAPKVTTTAAPVRQVEVDVAVNAPDKVIDLRTYIPNWDAVPSDQTPRLSIVRNTNRDLVTADISDTELTLSFARGQSGTATVTVAVKDASGASTQISFVITVQNAVVSAPVRLPSAPPPSLATPATGISPRP
jgi:hypothetical protein